MKKLIFGFVLGCLATLFGSAYGSMALLAKMFENESFKTSLKDNLTANLVRWMEKVAYEPSQTRPNGDGIVNYAPRNYQRPIRYGYDPNYPVTPKEN